MQESQHELVHSIEQRLEECVQVYRHLHQHPEVGLEEHNTAAFLRDIITGVEGVQLDPPLPDLPTAIIARITVPDPLNCILLRCELDALCFKEQSGLPHHSLNELHHACGHDGHMASLLTALRHAARHRGQLRRNVVFCFQPGEEGKAGASKLFKAKPDLLDSVDECYALHFGSMDYPGTVALAKGPVTALTSRLSIKIEGRSAHCMSPHAGVDANFVGCALVGQLYSLIGLRVPPLEGATLVVYKIAGGSASAKVSDHFELTASLRVTSMASFELLKQTITQLAEGLCKAYGATPTVTFFSGFYRPVINDEGVTSSTRKKLQSALEGLVIEENEKSFAGEDFCEFSERRPSCFIAVGAALPGSIDPVSKESKYPLHSPFHKFDEAVFKTSTKIWSTLIFT